MKSFPEKIKEARSALSMSQETLAEKVGASRRSIIAYEKGDKLRGAPRRGQGCVLGGSSRQVSVKSTNPSKKAFCVCRTLFCVRKRSCPKREDAMK